MIGIYLIRNKLNNKIYVGQSKNIELRFKEHLYHKSTELDNDIHVFGKDNFDFIILQECTIEQLDSLEDYYIKLYNSINNGYNKIAGGQHSIGESNGRAKLAEKDVVKIRDLYSLKVPMMDVYNKYKDKVSFGYFRNLWEGRSWTNVNMEVYTEANKYYHKFHTIEGYNKGSKLTDRDVFEIRKRYKDESIQEIYKSVKDIMSYDTLVAILKGRYFKNIPVYIKEEQRWNFSVKPVSTISVKESTSTIGT